MVSPDIRKRLKLPELSQIGYVVPDITETMAYYRDTFGIGPWMLRLEKPNPCIENGKEVHPSIKIALAYTGSIQIELIQIVEGESFHLKHLEDSKGGIHHLGFKVQDLKKRLDACQKAGIGILQLNTIKGTGYTVECAYLDTVEQADIIIEFIQAHFGPIPLPNNRWVHSIAARLGPKTSPDS